MNSIEGFWNEDTLPKYKHKYISYLGSKMILIKSFRFLILLAIIVHHLSAIIKREQVIHTWLPFDRNELKHNFLLLMVTHLIEMVTVTPAIWFCLIPFDSIFYFFICYAVLQFKMLRFALDKSISDNFIDGRLSFKDLIKHHNKIFK